VLDLAALGGRVSGAVRRDSVGEVARAEPVSGVAEDQLDPLARLHEADRSRARTDQLGQQLGRFV
jgi:hypothetical protein